MHLSSCLVKLFLGTIYTLNVYNNLKTLPTKEKYAMPFVQGKCDNCGGILTVDPSLKAANCPFCGVAYVVQDSINNYNTTINIDSIHADVVNISDESSSSGRLKAADAYMKLEQYDKAYSEYKRVTELAPQNHLGWLGLIASHTQNYAKRIYSRNELQILKDYSKSVLLFAPNGSGKELLLKFNTYTESEDAKNADKLESINLEMSEQKANLEQLNKQEDETKNSLETNKNERISLQSIINAPDGIKNVLLFSIGTFITIFGLLLCHMVISAAVNGQKFSFVGFIFALSIILVGGIPFYRIIHRKIQIRYMKRRVNELLAEHSKILEELNGIQKQKEIVRADIQSNQDELSRLD